MEYSLYQSFIQGEPDRTLKRYDELVNGNGNPSLEDLEDIENTLYLLNCELEGGGSGRIRDALEHCYSIMKNLQKCPK
jgi:hypothetical protein